MNKSIPMHSLTTRNIRMRVETEDPMHYGKKKLKIRGRDLMNLPKAVFKLMDLEVLDLSPERESCLDYRLAKLPPAIGQLLNLSTLILDTNGLVEVPTEITLLRNLERLCISNNQLTGLPDGFKKLKKMQSLHLANNLLDRFPLEICDLPELTFLDMCDNQIKVLPKKISKLQKLITLLLFINELSKLPESLCQLTELRCLWLGNNNIRVLPQGFGYLDKLDWRDRYTSTALDGNPLVKPPLETCKMGPEAIERYQGVGPNIDDANDSSNTKGGNRSRTTSDASGRSNISNKSSNSSFNDAPGNKSRLLNDSSTSRGKAMDASSVGKARTTSDARR